MHEPSDMHASDMQGSLGLPASKDADLHPIKPKVHASGKAKGDTIVELGEDYSVLPRKELSALSLVQVLSAVMTFWFQLLPQLHSQCS